jgi:hypothetical protein
MLPRIAERVKATRDASFQTQAGGAVVNRTEAIASLGGAALDNEECYLLSKLMRRSASCTSSTRPVSDTARRSPVWRPPSDAGR